jgi:hypothetical protein
MHTQGNLSPCLFFVTVLHFMNEYPFWPKSFLGNKLSPNSGENIRRFFRIIKRD